jgi:hypothetical protein
MGGNSSSRGHSLQIGNAQLTYNSNLLSTVNHLQANFGTGASKKLPRFIHAADEIGSASSSDPQNGKVDAWGFSDPHSFGQFVERFPGDAEYGLGGGDVVGVPNSMDISQPYGMIHADGCPGGSVYYRSTEEQRGRLLAGSLGYSLPELGVPRLIAAQETMCCVWISKTSNVPTITGGLIGMLAGSSSGVLTSYSLGTNGLKGHRFERGEITARWVLSPGIPIIAIAIDECLTISRKAQGRVWAAVLNAFGEIFYLTDLPGRMAVNRTAKLGPQSLDELAWETGRTVNWTLIEQSRRVAKHNPFETSYVDPSYSPRSSWTGSRLGKEQVASETREIESFLREKPKYFQNRCDGWDMRCRLEADFAGDDGSEAGEAFVVFHRGLDGSQSSIKRFKRIRSKQMGGDQSRSASPSPTVSMNVAGTTSLFGESPLATVVNTAWSFDRLPPEQSNSVHELDSHAPEEMVEEWRVAELSFGGLKSAQITAMTLDSSAYAILTASEDPLLNLSGSSTASSPMSSPMGSMQLPGSESDIPGQCARFLAAGTKTGVIFIWNVRTPVSGNAQLAHSIDPLRVIHTDSPQISCLGLSSLYLVHGGNDGLVQAWDPLASSNEPIRTLNSRFSSRARRRLFQAEGSSFGLSVNPFAAGAVCLDPDPTVLRGMVSLGTHLRYWSYSSSAADQYKTTKRRLRRSHRGSNQGSDKVTGAGRNAMKEYIATEKFILEQEVEHRRKEEARLAGRFGVDLLGPDATEEDIIAYATLLSQETAIADETRRQSESGSSETVTDATSSPIARFKPDAELDSELAEAIRLSLHESDHASSSTNATRPSADLPIRHVKGRGSPGRSPPRPGTGGCAVTAGELDLALQLGLAEERRRLKLEEEFPALPSMPSPQGKAVGKGRRRSP